MSFLLFLASGGLCTVLDLGFFSLLVTIVPKGVAFVMSYATCVSIRYLIDSRITFKHRQSEQPSATSSRFSIYFAANILVMLLSLLTFNLLTLGFSAVTAKVLSVPPSTVIGFLVMRFWVFAGTARQKS